VSGINSNLATLFRTVVVLFVTAGIISLRGEWQKPENLPGRTILFLVFSGVATGLSWLCYYRALQLGPVSQVAPIDKLSVAMVIVLSFIFLGEALTLKTILGGLLITGGAVILLL